MAKLIDVTVPKQWDGMMIKEILFDNYHFSKKSLSKIKLAKGIYLNDKQVYVSIRVSEGDTLQIYSPEEESEDILPQPISLDISYEDIDVVVINKPPGIVVHPTRNHYLGTIANGLIYYWQKKGEKIRFRPVHRLDKYTSGLFVVAKNQYSHHILASQLKDKKLKRIYHAVVHGRVEKEKDIIQLPILKDPSHGVKRIIVDESVSGAKPAITTYRVIKKFENYSLLELQLETGRTHQIRVHMSAIGHPLVGDELYGGKTERDLNRQALHAAQLEFYHPISNKYLCFNAPFPKDIENFILKLN